MYSSFLQSPDRQAVVVIYKTIRYAPPICTGGSAVNSKTDEEIMELTSIEVKANSMALTDICKAIERFAVISGVPCYTKLYAEYLGILI